jgi:enoyl-CoA hydratase/carnithine racemase
MSDDPVLQEPRGHVLLVTLNRPDARNAVNAALAQGVADALDALDADPELQVGVLTGAGKGFSSGMDLKAFVTGERPWVGDRGFAGLTRRAADKPLIAAVEGFAVAGGLEIALSCDLIVCGRDARLGIAEVKRGLVAAGGALLRLPRRIPYHLAMEMALTGDFIDGARAYEIGLVNRAVEPGTALDEALSLAETIAANAPLSLAASKRLIAQAQSIDEPEAWQLNDEISGPVFASEDAREGATAFAEKRAPEWKGQ